MTTPTRSGIRTCGALAVAALLCAPGSVQAESLGLRVKQAGDTGGGGGDLQADLPVLLEIDRRGGNPDGPVPRAWIEESFAGMTESGVQNCESRAARLSGAPGLSPPVRDFNMLAVALVTPTGLHVLDPRGGLRGARSLAFADFGGTASSWDWGVRSGMFHALLPARGEVITVDPGAWRVTGRRPVEGVPIAVLEDETGSPVVLAHRGGIDEVSWPTRPDRKPVAVPTGNTRLVALGSGRLGAVAPGRFHIIDGDMVRSLSTRLDAQAYLVPARTIFGLDADGALRYVDPATGAGGAVTGMAGISSTRLWTTPDGRMLVVWRPEGKEFHVVDVAKRARAHTVLLDGPRSFAASASFLFVRSAAQGELSVVPRQGLLDGRPAGLRRIAAGELPGLGRDLPLAATDDGTASWIDRERAQVYVYHEGMNIPSATLRMPTPDVLDLALVGPLVRPAGPGGYTATATIDEPGEYVAVAMTGGAVPPTCHRFVLVGKAGTSRPAERFTMTKMDGPRNSTVGNTATFRFRVAAADGGVLPEMPSIGVLMMEVGGNHQERWRAVRESDGDLRAEITPHRPGLYMVMPDQATFPGRLMGRPVITLEVAPAQ